MIRTAVLMAGVALGVSALVGPASAEPLPRRPVLTASAALDIAKHALDQCKSQGYEVAITILDPGGATRLAVASQDVQPLSVGLSARKARAVIMFRMSSGDLAARFKANPAYGQAMATAAPDIAATQGAIPIVVGGQFIGAIGISGAPGGDKDEACAAAGLAAAADQLR